MKTTKWIALGLGLLAAAPAAAREERVFSTREIRRTLPTGAGCRLVVDNVVGGISVRGHDRDEVDLVAVETVRAESAERAERASREVELDVGSRGPEVELFVDGPFRDPDDRHQWARNHRDAGYTVSYDFEVRVPRRCDLDLRTITGGEVEVADVGGALELRNVNGGIRLDRVAGSGGEVTTVNGPIVGDFPANPTSDLRFQTVNGRIEVTFPRGLAADLVLATSWGEMWSEFDAEPLPAPAPERRREDGRLVIEVGGGALLRVGAGGPRLEFETLNGDILIRREG